MMDIFLLDPSFDANNTSRDVTIVAGVFHALKDYVTPFVIALAVTCNVCIMVAIYRSRLKEYASMIYVTAELLSATFSLTSVASAWLTSYVPGMTHSDWWCMVTSFNTHVTSFLSLWFVLLLTCDRTVVLYKPKCLESVNYLQSPLVAAVLAVLLTLAGVAIYMNESLLFGAVVISGRPMCLPRSQFSHDWSLLTIMDTVVNFVVVHAIIIAANTYNAIQYRKLNVTSARSHGGSFVFRSQSKPASRRLSRSEHCLDMDLHKMTVCFTYGYLLLVLPGNCLRFIVSIGTLTPDQYPRAYVWQQLLFYLYILRTVLLPIFLLCVGVIRQAFGLCRRRASRSCSRNSPNRFGQTSSAKAEAVQAMVPMTTFR